MPAQNKSRRWVFIVALALLAVVGGFFLQEQMRLRDRSQPDTTAEPQDQPSSSQSDRGQQPEIARENSTPTAPEPGVSHHPSIPTTPAIKPESGRLVFETNGGQLAEETYQLERLPGGEYKLTSQGFFSLSVFLAEVKLDYTQEILTDADLRPLSFFLEIQGPAGFGHRSTSLKIEGEKATLSAGEESHELPVPKGRFVLLGMFSSYALAAKLLTSRERTQLMAVVAAEPGGDPSQEKAIFSFPMEAIKLPPVRIRDSATGKEQEIEQYLLHMGDEQQQGTDRLQLLAVEGEFLGLIGIPAHPSGDSFRIYRVDLFPNGFDLVSTP